MVHAGIKGIQGLGVRDEGLGDQGWGFRDEGLGLRDWDFMFRDISKMEIE